MQPPDPFGGRPPGPPPDHTQLGPRAVWHDVGQPPAPGRGPTGGGNPNRTWLIVALALGALLIIGGAVTVGIVIHERSGGTSSATPPLAASSRAASSSRPTTATATATGTPYVPAPARAQADCQAPPAVDAGGVTNSYEPAKAFDGIESTAWRCQGDASGRGITFDFGAQVTVTSVGLVPGYDKTDPVNGADRFLNSRRIQSARWVFDDGSSVEVTPAGQRGMVTQAITPTQTQTVKLVIESTIAGTAVSTNTGRSVDATDYTSISEVAFQALQ